MALEDAGDMESVQSRSHGSRSYFEAIYNAMQYLVISVILPKWWYAM